MDPASLQMPKEGNGLSALFVSLINEMKNSTPVWEDFITKSNKLNSALKVVSTALAAFFDAFQKIADLATNAQGATKEIGATLTRLCIRQKAMEDKSRILSKLLVESVSVPLAEKLEGEWKKTYLQLDKERMKDLKKVKADLKKASNDTLRLKKKAAKKGAMMSGKNNLEQQLKLALEDMQDRYIAVEDIERKHVRRALIEERARFCHFIVCLKPVLDCQLGMLNDMGQISELLDSLCMQASDPESLPTESEALLMNMHAGSTAVSGGPENSSLGSRKSSMASISSLTSNSSAGSGPSPAHQIPTKFQPILYPHCMAAWRNSLCRPGVPQTGSMRLSSISSQDSGFTSQDTLYLQGMQVLKSRDYQFMRTASGPSLSSSGGASKLPGAEGILDTTVRDEDTAEGSGAESDTEGEGEEDEEEDEDEEEEAKTPSTPPTEDSYKQDKTMDRPHTISGAYTSQTSRPTLSSMTFEPPPELYPNQALPPPVYANLANLAQAASRKCSIPAGMERTPPPPPLQPQNTAHDHRRMTVPAVPTAAAIQQAMVKEAEDAGRTEFHAELDRAVSELDRLTADMLADPSTKPPPPMRRNSAMASGPSSPEAHSPAARTPLPPSPGPLPPPGLMRSVSQGAPPPTSPKPKVHAGQFRPANLPGPAGDAIKKAPPSPNFSGRRHSSIQSAKSPGEVQQSTGGAAALAARKASFQAPSNSAGSQPPTNCMAELTSVLKQRLHTQQHTQQLTPEQQLQQQQYLQKQQLLQQQQQQYMQQLQKQEKQQQQQQHHQQQPQQQPPQQIYAQQQFLPQQQPQPQQPQQQRESRDSSPECTDGLSAALRAQGLRLRPTPFRNDRSAPNLG